MSIRTRPASREYRDNFANVFKKPKKQPCGHPIESVLGGPGDFATRYCKDCECDAGKK